MLLTAIDFILHLNQHLAMLIAAVGPWVYLILFLIIFAETGLVVTPFLPGDSLLFVAGSLSAITWLNPHLLILLLISAAILGNTVNYFIGHWFGEHLFRNPHSKIFKRTHLDAAHIFYERHGGMAVIISRFLPIVRTFVPFVAGMAQMTYRRFSLFNFVGAFLWVAGLTYLGYFFGQLPLVKNNFSWVILTIIFLSIIPVIAGVIKQWLARS